MYGTAFFVRNGDRYFINNDRGELVVARLSPKGFEEISRTGLIEPTHPYPRRRELPNVLWSHAAYANRHIVIRNDHEIVRFSLASRAVNAGNRDGHARVLRLFFVLLLLTIAGARSGRGHPGSGARTGWRPLDRGRQRHAHGRRPRSIRCVVSDRGLQMVVGVRRLPESHRSGREGRVRSGAERRHLRAAPVEHRPAVSRSPRTPVAAKPTRWRGWSACCPHTRPRSTRWRSLPAPDRTGSCSWPAITTPPCCFRRSRAGRSARSARRRAASRWRRRGTGCRRTARSTRSTATRSASTLTGSRPGRRRSSRARASRISRVHGESRRFSRSTTRFEERYPIVDNFGLAGAGLKYAFAADGAADAGDAAPRLLRYLIMLMSWQQFRMELDGGETEAPTWDLAQARAQGGALLVSSLPDDDRFKPLAAKALADGRLTQIAGELTDEELVALCDYRAASRRARRRGEPFLVQFTPRGPIVTECPRTPDSRGSLFDYFWRSRDQLFLRHLDGVAAADARGTAADGVGTRAHPRRRSRPGGRDLARRRSPDHSAAGLLTGPRRRRAGRDQRRRLAADDHAGAIRADRNGTRPAARRPAARTAAGRSAGVLRLRPHCAVHRRAGAERSLLAAVSSR